MGGAAVVQRAGARETVAPEVAEIEPLQRGEGVRGEVSLRLRGREVGEHVALGDGARGVEHELPPGEVVVFGEERSGGGVGGAGQVGGLGPVVGPHVLPRPRAGERVPRHRLRHRRPREHVRAGHRRGAAQQGGVRRPQRRLGNPVQRHSVVLGQERGGHALPLEHGLALRQVHEWRGAGRNREDGLVRPEEGVVPGDRVQGVHGPERVVRGFWDSGHGGGGVPRVVLLLGSVAGEDLHALVRQVGGEGLHAGVRDHVVGHRRGSCQVSAVLVRLFSELLQPLQSTRFQVFEPLEPPSFVR